MPQAVAIEWGRHTKSAVRRIDSTSGALYGGFWRFARSTTAQGTGIDRVCLRGQPSRCGSKKSRDNEIRTTPK